MYNLRTMQTLWMCWTHYFGCSVSPLSYTFLRTHFTWPCSYLLVSMCILIETAQQIVQMCDMDSLRTPQCALGWTVFKITFQKNLRRIHAGMWERNWSSNISWWREKSANCITLVSIIIAYLSQLHSQVYRLWVSRDVSEHRIWYGWVEE